MSITQRGSDVLWCFLVQSGRLSSGADVGSGGFGAQAIELGAHIAHATRDDNATILSAA